MVMNILKSSDIRIANRFINAVLSAGFVKFDVGKFLTENVRDERVDDYLLKVLSLPYEDFVALLTPYGETSCMCRDILQQQLATELNNSMCYLPYEQEMPPKPSPIYPRWRGHKVSNKKKGW